MATTPKYALRYPVLGDAPNGPSAFQNLATDVENLLYGRLPTTRVRAGTNFDKTNAALATALTIPVEASTTYIVDGFLTWFANSDIDAKFGWNFPAGLTGYYSIATTQSTDDAANVGGQRIGDTDYGTVPIADPWHVAGDPEIPTVWNSGLLHGHVSTVSAGNLVLTFAQQFANAGKTASFKVGSWVRLTPAQAGN
jgi:hypothetical protein